MKLLKIDTEPLIYEFRIGTALFHSVKPPIKKYINQIENIWKNYSLYPEMSDITQKNDDNQLIIDSLKEHGIFQVDAEKDLFGTKYTPNIFKIKPERIFSDEEFQRIKFFMDEKQFCNLAGLFWSENEISQINKIDWLPRPNREMAIGTTGGSWSCNIFTFNMNSYLVIFKHIGGEPHYFQDIMLGDEELFYNDDEFFTGQKLLEVLEILPDGKFKHVIDAWELFYPARYQMFIGGHPFNDPLDKDYKPDTRAIFLLWLFRLQEQLIKLRELCYKGKTILYTSDLNEMNGKYVEYDITYTPEIQLEIHSKKEKLKLYAVVNEYFIPVQKNIN